MSVLGDPDRRVSQSRRRKPNRLAGGTPRRRWSMLLALVLLLGAAVPAQPVLSSEPEATTAQSATEEPIDPDCVPPDQVVSSTEEPDGICPETSAGEPTPDPAPDPTGPSQPSTPSTPTGGGGTPTQAGSGDGQERAEGTTEAGRETPRRSGRRPRTRRKAQRKAAGRGERRRGRRHAERGRRHSRRGAKHRKRRPGKRARSRQRKLKPIPGWARRLLSQPLPDPLPAGKRLDPGFARALERSARERHVSWPLMLAILRARGQEGSAPAGPAALRSLARRLADLGAARHPERAIEAFGGGDKAAELAPGIGTSVTFVDRVLALAGYNRAVGLRGLVRGLDAVKPTLIRRVLASDRLVIYPGGRDDVEDGRIDERVLVLLLYMAHRHGELTVSSLQTGHSFFTKSGNISNHTLGQAVDIGALGGTPVAGHQELGGVTERALRNILLLPKDFWPSELISLFELGGPSFAMADHADHIHVGF